MLLILRSQLTRNFALGVYGKELCTLGTMRCLATKLSSPLRPGVQRQPGRLFYILQMHQRQAIEMQMRLTSSEQQPVGRSCFSGPCDDCNLMLAVYAEHHQRQSAIHTPQTRHVEAFGVAVAQQENVQTLNI